MLFTIQALVCAIPVCCHHALQVKYILDRKSNSGERQLFGSLEVEARGDGNTPGALSVRRGADGLVPNCLQYLFSFIRGHARGSGRHRTHVFLSARLGITLVTKASWVSGYSLKTRKIPLHEKKKGPLPMFALVRSSLLQPNEDNSLSVSRSTNVS
jgi:hypothetical protein